MAFATVPKRPRASHASPGRYGPSTSRKDTAKHEVAHALYAYSLKYPLVRVVVMERTGYTGFP
jgi:hypothetical protein